MAILVSSTSPFFDRKKAELLFEENRGNLDDRDGFDVLLTAGVFYNVYDNGYIGSVFAYKSTDGKIWLGGYAVRHKHRACIEAVKKVSAMFKDIYAETRHKTAVICLLRAGYEWFDKEHGILRRKIDEQQQAQSANG